MAGNKERVVDIGEIRSQVQETKAELNRRHLSELEKKLPKMRLRAHMVFQVNRY